jgi:peptidoglycan/LPS O-acetylase OafA/YrhL
MALGQIMNVGHGWMIGRDLIVPPIRPQEQRLDGDRRSVKIAKMTDATPTQIVQTAGVPTDIDHSAVHNPARRLLHLDGWRGLCIIMVLCGHFLPFHGLDFGSLGVEMFFVLSGRLMADILFIEKFPLGRFFLRRFSRVWPGLAVYVAFCAVCFSSVSGFLHVTPVSIVSALLFLSNYRIMLLGQTQLLDHTWSLSVEEHSYLALGLLSFLLRQQKLAIVKTVILGLALVMAVNGLVQAYIFPIHVIDVPTSQGDASTVFDVYWRSDIRAASVFLAAFVYLQFLARGSRDLSKWLVFLLPGIAVLTFVSHVPESLSFTLGTLCLAVTVCALDGETNPFRLLLHNRGLRAFGAWSFSIYVWQQLFYKLFQAMRASGSLTPIEGLIWRPAFVIAACVAGIASFYYVEKPARRFINARIDARISARVDARARR